MAATQPYDDKKSVKVIATIQPTMTIYNWAKLVVGVLNNEKNVSDDDNGDHKPHQG
jgi:hypothetical protein